jgi:hypothetical protein
MYQAPRPDPRFFRGCINGLIIMAAFYTILALAFCSH